MHRLTRSIVTLVAGILLVLVSAGACDDGATGPGTQPAGTVVPTDDDDGPDDPGDDSSGPGDDSEGPGDDGPSDGSGDADESEGADDGGVPGRGGDTGRESG